MLTPVYFNLFTISFSCFTNTVSFTSNLDGFLDIINHLLIVIIMYHKSISSDSFVIKITPSPNGKMVDVESGWFITTRRNSFNLRWIARLPRGISSSGAEWFLLENLIYHQNAHLFVTNANIQVKIQYILILHYP